MAHHQTRRQGLKIASDRPQPLGLAAGLRSFRLLDPGRTDVKALVREHGAFVQRALDRMRAP